ncbi:hypothetical protein DL768_007566 [Monosporascus sp. mg162]|nr:hypothetical protein DL768_007566 [Monosporascus sp. mg162]
MESQSADAVAEWQEFELQLNLFVERLRPTIAHINLASQDASYVRSAVEALEENAAQLGTLVGECRKLCNSLREARNASLTIEGIYSKLTKLEEAVKPRPAAIEALLDPLIRRPEAPNVVLDHLRDILATCRTYSDNHLTKAQVVRVQNSLDRLVQGLEESEQRHQSLAGKIDKISELPSTQAVMDSVKTTNADLLEALTSKINEAAERPPQDLMDKLSTISSEPPKVLMDKLSTMSTEPPKVLIDKLSAISSEPPKALMDKLVTMSAEPPQVLMDKLNTISSEPPKVLMDKLNTISSEPPKVLMDKLSTIVSEPPRALTDQLRTKSAELLEGLGHKIDEASKKPPQALTDRLDALSSQLPNAITDKIVEISAQPLQALVDKLDALPTEPARPSPPRASDILRDLRLFFSEASSSSLGGEQSSSRTDIPRAGGPEDDLDDLVHGLRDLLWRMEVSRPRSRRGSSTPEDRDSLGTAGSAHEAPLDSMEEYSAGGPAPASQSARTSPARNPSKRPKRARSDSDSNGAEAVAEQAGVDARSIRFWRKTLGVVETVAQMTFPDPDAPDFLPRRARQLFLGLLAGNIESPERFEGFILDKNFRSDGWICCERLCAGNEKRVTPDDASGCSHCSQEKCLQIFKLDKGVLFRVL